LLLIPVFYNCSTTNNVKQNDTDSPIYYDYAGKIENEALEFIRNAYNWNTEKILIIRYLQPISISPCKFNYDYIPDSGKEWREAFFENINTEDCKNIEVLANGEKAKSLDNVVYFDDKNDFLFDKFFSRKKSCFGVMVINNKGYYIQHNGHYSAEQVGKYIENLRKP
ncbi:MAG: hypothetical protein KDC56_04320, partial [Flavobacteriaceae bacterium]|nr:hypothetical protein [Flavobacteriaceae bacterium]